MERRSFLKILGLVTGGALIHLPAVHAIERALLVAPGIGADSEFFFKLNGVDYGDWIRVIESPRLEYEMINITSLGDDTERFIPGLFKSSPLELEFVDLPEGMREGLLDHVSAPVDFELGHRPSEWSWTGRAFLSQTDHGARFQFTLVAPVEIHANG